MPDRAAAVAEPLIPHEAAHERYPRVRQSLLATFDRCPLSARFSLDHEQGWSGHPQARGKVGHRVFARCLELMGEQQERSIPVELAMEVFHEELSQRAADGMCPSCGLPGPERAGSKHWRCADPECGKEFWSDEAALPAEQIADLRVSVIKWAHDNVWSVENLVSVEERLEGVVHYAPPHEHVERTITGQLDALFVEGDHDERAIVLDWKDTWALPPPTEVSFTGYFQQRFYGVLVLQKYPSIQEVVLREFYVRRSEGREARITRQSLTDAEAELGALVERFDRAVANDLWQPSPGKHCGFCPRPTACPIFPDVRVDGAVESEDDARRVAGELAVAEAAVKQRKRALQAWANVHGSVPVADAKARREWAFVEHTRTERPEREALERALRSGDVDLDSLYPTRPQTKFELTQAGNGAQVTAEDARIAEQLRASLDRATAGRKRKRSKR